MATALLGSHTRLDREKGALLLKSELDVAEDKPTAAMEVRHSPKFPWPLLWCALTTIHLAQVIERLFAAEGTWESLHGGLLAVSVRALGGRGATRPCWPTVRAPLDRGGCGAAAGRGGRGVRQPVRQAARALRVQGATGGRRCACAGVRALRHGPL